MKRNEVMNILNFRHACKEFDVNTLDDLEEEGIMIVSKLEMYFPPSFFDIMVRLIVHLVREIKI